MNVEPLAGIIANVAARWSDPDYEPRATASRLTLLEANSFTPEALIFAINQQMAQLHEDALIRWIAGRRTRHPAHVGVINPGNVPMAGLQDFLAVIMTGHRYLGTVSRRSSRLLPAFATDLIESGADIHVTFADTDTLLARASALIATGTDATMQTIRDCALDAQIAGTRTLLRGHRYSVGVIATGESPELFERLAEDTLLHEGLGCRNIAVLFAPQGDTPDELLAAMARFRSVFPAHDKTRGKLKMQIAYQAAIGSPHGHAEDNSFLVSKGSAEPQAPGHLRWTEYSQLQEVVQWISDRVDKLQVVACSPAVRDRIGDLPVELVDIGDCQRPPLGWHQDQTDVIRFLQSLADTRA